METRETSSADIASIQPSEGAEESTFGLTFAKLVLWLLGVGFAVIAGVAVYGVCCRWITAAPRDWTQTLGPWIVIGSFGPVAVLLLVGAVAISRDMRLEGRLYIQFPKQPWRHRSDWAESRSEHGLMAQAVCFSLLSLSGNCLIWGICIMTMLQPNSFEANVESLGAYMAVLAFGLICLGFGAYSVGISRDALRYRDVKCELVNLPFRPGLPVRCIVVWKERYPTIPILVRLKCSSTRTSYAQFMGEEVSEGDTYEYDRYEARYIASIQTDSITKRPLPLAIRIPIPESAPETSRRASTKWMLELEWPSRTGVAHSIGFEIPVFRAQSLDLDSNSQTITATTQAFDEKYPCRNNSGYADAATPESLTHLIESYEGSLTELSQEKWELLLPKYASPKVKSRLLFFVVLFAFVGGGVAVGGILGMAFIGLALYFFALASGKQKLSVDGECIYVRKQKIWHREIKILFSDVIEFSHVQVERSRYGVGIHQIFAKLKSGDQIILIENALSPLIARRVCKKLRSSVPLLSANAS